MDFWATEYTKLAGWGGIAAPFAGAAAAGGVNYLTQRQNLDELGAEDVGVDRGELMKRTVGGGVMGALPGVFMDVDPGHGPAALQTGLGAGLGGMWGISRRDKAQERLDAMDR